MLLWKRRLAAKEGVEVATGRDNELCCVERVATSVTPPKKEVCRWMK